MSRRRATRKESRRNCGNRERRELIRRGFSFSSSFFFFFVSVIQRGGINCSLLLSHRVHDPHGRADSNSASRGAGRRRLKSGPMNHVVRKRCLRNDRFEPIPARLSVRGPLARSCTQKKTSWRREGGRGGSRSSPLGTTEQHEKRRISIIESRNRIATEQAQRLGGTRIPSRKASPAT